MNKLESKSIELNNRISSEQGTQMTELKCNLLHLASDILTTSVLSMEI